MNFFQESFCNMQPTGTIWCHGRGGGGGWGGESLCERSRGQAGGGGCGRKELKILLHLISHSVNL